MSARNTQSGAAMIEVLVSMLITAFGMLGFVGLQARTSVASLEGNQRTQALLLLNDIAQRINLNRVDALSYVGTDIGVVDPGTCPAAPTSTRDLCEWANLIRGSAEQQGGTKLGAMLGARGCVQNLGGGAYLISLVWQGLQATGPATVSCGVDAYHSESLRRGASTIVRIGTLS